MMVISAFFVLKPRVSARCLRWSDDTFSFPDIFPASRAVFSSMLVFLMLMHRMMRVQVGFQIIFYKVQQVIVDGVV